MISSLGSASIPQYLLTSTFYILQKRRNVRISGEAVPFLHLFICIGFTPIMSAVSAVFKSVISKLRSIISDTISFLMRPPTNIIERIKELGGYCSEQYLFPDEVFK